MTLANWRSLAVKLGVPSKTFKLFERRSTQSPTNQLFEYVGSTCPHMTVKTLEEALTKMERKDLLAILHEKSPQGKLNSYLRLDNKLQRFSTMLRCDAILQRKRMLITEIVHANRYWRYCLHFASSGAYDRQCRLFRKEMILNLLSFLYSAICEFLSSLRWLDWIFWGWYLPTLSINYVGMSKDMEKRLPQLYYIKMKISYDLGYIAIGVAMAT